MRRQTLVSLIKFVIYGVACLALLVGLAAKVGRITFFSHRASYHAVLDDASGLFPRDDVKIAGVTVGQVHGVSVRRGQAVVTFSVDKKIHLTTSTQVGLRWHDIIGNKYLYVYPGQSGPPLAQGGTIPASQTVSGADIGDFLNAVGPFLKALDPKDVNAFTQAIVAALNNNEEQVRSLLSNTASVSSTVGNLDTQVGSVVDNFEKVLGALRARNGDLGTTIDHLSAVAQQLADHNADLDALVGNVSAVNAQLAQLLNDRGGDITQTVTNLQAIAKVLAQHHDDLNADLGTLSAGLAPYTQISSFGQWFQIRVVYTCLAQQKTCTYEQPANAAPLKSSNSASASGRSAASPAAPAAAGPATAVAPVAPVAPAVGAAPGPTGANAVTDFALYGRAGG